MKKQQVAKKMNSFKPLKWEDYAKLGGKEQASYNTQEREYNFERKMKKKHDMASGVRKLNNFFK